MATPRSADKDTIERLETIIKDQAATNKAMLSLMEQFATTNQIMQADRPKDQVEDQRRPEDKIETSEKFETIEDKWDSILKDGGQQGYVMSIKPWAARNGAAHSFKVTGVTAAEIYYYHHLYDTTENVGRGVTEAILSVTKVKGLVFDTDVSGLYKALRSTKENNKHLFDQTVIDRIYAGPGALPKSIGDVTNMMPDIPETPEHKGVFGIKLDGTIDRQYIDRKSKLENGATIDLKLFMDYHTRNSSGGLLWRRTPLTGG